MLTYYVKELAKIQWIVFHEYLYCIINIIYFKALSVQYFLAVFFLQVGKMVMMFFLLYTEIRRKKRYNFSILQFKGYRFYT